MEVIHFIVGHHRNSHGRISIIFKREWPYFTIFIMIMICWHNVFVGQLLHHHRDLPPWRPRRPGQRARAGWEEVEEARGRKQSISGQNQSSFCENNRQFRKLQIYRSNLLQSINLLQSTNKSLQSVDKHSMWKKSFMKVWSLSFFSQLHQSTESF